MNNNKGIILVLCGVLGVFSVGRAHANLSLDTEDPMFLEGKGDLLSRTGFDLSSDIARLTEKISYGLNSQLAIAADIGYQQDMDGENDGFSNVGLGFVYRMNDGQIKSDLFGGVRFSGDAKVSAFDDTVYYAGVKLGRQWQRLTLSGTIKTSWIFNDLNGMAFIDLTPEAYFRIAQNWTAGAGFTWRKVTDSAFDSRWATLKVARQYGRTMYSGVVNYELDSHDLWLGANVNILF